MGMDSDLFDEEELEVFSVIGLIRRCDYCGRIIAGDVYEAQDPYFLFCSEGCAEDWDNEDWIENPDLDNNEDPDNV